MYAMKNKSSDDFTAAPEKYPQGRFKPKPCRLCGTQFNPLAPSHLYCSDACSQRGLTSAYLKRNYGITIEDYERMLEAQNHRCKLCGGDGFPMDPARHKVRLVVDHCHETGEIRGLLCHNCNRGLGLFKDNPSLLLSAAAYLEGATTIPRGSRPKRVEARGP
jgi:hypothetical protein